MNTVSYTIVGTTQEEGGTFVQLPLTISPKGLRTFTIDMDELDIHETGTKNKNGQIVHYMTFKITNNDTKK